MSSLLNIISPLSTLLLIIFYLFFQKRNNDKKFWVIFVYVTLSFIFDLLPHFFSLKGFYFYSSFSVIEYFLFSYFLFLCYRDRIIKKLIIGSAVVFVLACSYSILNLYQTQFDYVSSSVGNTLILIFCIFFFYEQLKNPEINFIYASKSFWIVTGFLVYVSATLFLFISTGVKGKEKNPDLWLFNVIFNIIKNLLFAIAVYKPLTMLIDSSAEKKP